jgi:hypothetical protein
MKKKALARRLPTPKSGDSLDEMEAAAHRDAMRNPHYVRWLKLWNSRAEIKNRMMVLEDCDECLTSEMAHLANLIPDAHKVVKLRSTEALR